MATEFCITAITPGAKLGDKTTRAGKTWASILECIAKQPGYQRIYWGYEVEHENNVDLLVDWDSVDAHKRFMASPEYGPFGGEFGSIMGGPVHVHHRNMQPHPPIAPFSAPVTELCTFFLAPDISPEAQKKYEAEMKSFAEVIEKHAKGCKGTSMGWVMEQMSHGNLGKTKAHTLAVGWESVEAHMAYRETKEFQDSIKPVRELVKGAEVHHVKLQSF
ncbi:MAG: hypothetical protein M1834_008303 [Cirrosporium novae-zelandiae]|nr:MAG: hypothetical protein M1834_008303 [Cirrosporium novae-zelandiae]